MVAAAGPPILDRENSDVGIYLQVLQKVRGQEDVDMEFNDIVMQTRQDALVKNPLAELFKPCYRCLALFNTENITGFVTQILL